MVLLCESMFVHQAGRSGRRKKWRRLRALERLRDIQFGVYYGFVFLGEFAEPLDASVRAKRWGSRRSTRRWPDRTQ